MEKMKFNFQKDVTYEFSWPKRSYTCTFCQKEYKSAQALGGHMNVHRRDRAKLMGELSPPSNDLNPNPNPNFSSTLSSYDPNPNPIPIFSSTPSSYGLNLGSNTNPTFSSSSSNGTNIGCNPNPNANFSSSSKTMFLPYFAYGTPLVPSFCASAEEGKRCLKNEMENEFRVIKKRKSILRIDVGVGLINEANEDLDLELRLGCS